MTSHSLTSTPAPAGDDALADLLTRALAEAAAASPANAIAPADARERLRSRLAASHAAEAAMVTTRLRRVAPRPLAPGVIERLLYAASASAARRPGEPLRVRLVELAPGAKLAATVLGDERLLRQRHREWLVLRGSVQLGAQTLALRDYHVIPAGHTMPVLASSHGALLFLRESDLPATASDSPHTVRDAAAGWSAFAPAIERRVLWQREGQAALLYRAGPGAQVPHHTHGHDEECLMIEGDLFLNDVLLQAGDYQLAPVGTDHRVTETDTGAVIYAHGDADLRFMG